MMADAEMAAQHLDVLAERTVGLEAALPCGDAVAAAVDRGGRDRQRLGQPGAQLLLLRDRAPARAAAQEAGYVDRLDVAKRARERDHLPHFGGEAARELARVDP